MIFDKSIFELFNRESFQYRKGDDEVKDQYIAKLESWKSWVKEFTRHVDKFEEPIFQSWQNSGQLGKYFWARLKFTPYTASASCISMHSNIQGFTLECGFEFKNEGNSNISKEEYNKLLLKNLKLWAEDNKVDGDLFYIAAKNNKFTLNEYFSSTERTNWFANTKGININVGVSFRPEEVSELDTESKKLIEILEKLSFLYEKVQKPHNIFTTLKNSSDIIPDKYDGSYELVRETVKAYENVAYDKLTLDDLDAMFFMCIGTYKHGADAKKQLVSKSNLPENEKVRITDLIDTISERAREGYYSHAEGGAGNFGLFGESVGSLRASYKPDDDIKGAMNFIKMCVRINDLNDEEEIFSICEPVLKAGVKGMQTGKISKFLHCLKPDMFPIINEKQGEETNVYDSLGIKLTKAKEAANFIGNTRVIKDFRDKYLDFKNYRVMDIVEEKQTQIKYWLGGANYEEEDVSQEFINNNVFAIGWVDEDIKYVLGNEEQLKSIFDKYSLTNNARKMFNLLFHIKAGDRIAIKSTFAKDKTSILRIKAIGTVQSDFESGYSYDVNLGHTIPVKWEEVKIFDLENIGGYWRTLTEVTDKDHISRIFLKEEGVDQTIKSYSKEQFLEDAYISEDKYNLIVSRLNNKKNIILQGAPGVGKSYLAKKIAYSVLGQEDESKVQMIQFHQSYSYEDFIMGYRPNISGGFDIVEGIFYKFCKTAMENPNDKFFFIIDEINRGNLSKIFGELMLLIEVDKRGEGFAMPTVYSEEKFFIPDNIYIIGLMNTADRSLALIDYALRRRFSFIDIEPAFGEQFKKYTEQFKETNLENVLEVIHTINEEIESDESLGKGFKIGHSYFCNLKSADNNELVEIIDCEIIPLLEEYWIESIDKVDSYSNSLHEALMNG